ncbi:hypothetical protein LOC68_08715 [Blastopirellula sp. JC732]|uniref:Uncharacterized protein n=1 Tax=Blastopirellula sediminis TaxID=2894196 RepID=A0A9X1MLJ5_9BACT|nr:hypothetical protein [Blastopirellula sediminis]MCC9608748.1 hypothetical protein [Blastopirellula sediminis]MCC9628475.1 hypothetical protein [Blastopirellula sediminis]
MKNALCDDLPHLSAKEIATRCQAIRMKWSGLETELRKMDGERRMRVLDRTLQYGSVEAPVRRRTKPSLQFVQLIAG